MLLFAAWGVIKILKRRPESGIDPAILETFRLRVRAWWILFAVLAAAFLLASRRDHRAVLSDFVLGIAGVHYRDSHPARRPSHAVLGVLACSRRCSSFWWGWDTVLRLVQRS